MARASARASPSRQSPAFISDRDVLRLGIALACGLVPLLFLRWLVRRTERMGNLERRVLWVLAGAGFALGALSAFLEDKGLSIAGVSLRVGTRGATEPLLAMVLFVAPLEEALKLLPVWRLYARHRIANTASGVSYAAACASGFACSQTGLYVFANFSELEVLRALLAIPAHVFFAGIWGYALGSGTSARGQWFSLAWLLAMLAHALFAHIVFGRGEGLLILVVPLLVAMAFIALSTVRELLPTEPVSSRRLARLVTMAEPPSLHEVREALRRPNRPLLVHWIAIGAFVTLGMMIALFAAAVYFGYRFGIDFALASESDARSTGPLILLGTAVLAAFPLSAFLVARASATDTVFEPAIGSALAIGLVVLLVSLTAPVGVLFALSGAPAAFLLACAGAWLGVSRHAPDGQPSSR